MKKPMTQEEKLWFFRGFLHAEATEFAKEFDYTVEEATELLLREFVRRHRISKGKTEETE
ncbi:hypothetical protein [Bacillus sp. UNC437CL72CviS29]|uniref:hypothetical protein n=1 Tax=Bacillus sp. UNC437CL72CviS29 TaxID=1340430 RepID=UPI00047A6412|nr:hypothetical protein [Bacillus sp. UNC437CL72CviS29]